MTRIKIGFGVLVGSAMAMLLCASVLYASAAISQGYLTDEDLSVGMLVSRSSDSSAVVPASSETSKELMGVVSSRALLEISEGKQREVQVATSGTTEALVSTLNGEIKAGDKIAPSPAAGVGMRATENGEVVGAAAAGFDQARSVTEREIVAKDGSRTTVQIGLVPVQVGVTYFEKSNKSVLPDFITNLARSVAGREVSVARVIAAGAILLVGLVVVVVLVSSSARSSIISIGRNPLAASAVHRGLLEASGLAIGILLVMLIAVYLVLVI